VAFAAALVASAAALVLGCSDEKPSEAPARGAGAADNGQPPASTAVVADANAGSASSTLESADAAVWSSTSIARLSADAIVLGVCRLKSLNPGGTDCTGLQDLIGCAREHCGLEACVETCDEYVQCVLPADDQCRAADTCVNSQPCLDCIASNLVCLSAQCTDLISCGSTASGGACDQLETCCKAQPDPTACLGFTGAARMFSGDGFCQMLIEDKGFISAYASKVPCMF
jgi:hypothetical protein